MYIPKGRQIVVRTPMAATVLMGFVLGCGQSPPGTSDPAVARETLQNALSAWKSGDTVDSYKQTTPAVTVSDNQWQQGAKLHDFEFVGDSKPDGYDVRFKVKLSVEKAGKKSQEKAVYNVSTSPRLVVVRSEPDS